MALAQIESIRRLELVKRSAELGNYLVEILKERIAPGGVEHTVRGLGLLAGVELRKPDGSPATAQSFNAIKSMLARGFILLPEGEHANVISFTPPLTIGKTQLSMTVNALAQILARPGPNQ